MEFLKQVLKGVVIGVANIIPGVSGGTMMVSMGIYDLLIHSITHLFKQFGKSIRTLLPYFIGMIVGIAVAVGLFIFLPKFLIGQLIAHTAIPENSRFVRSLLEGILKIAIFLGYMACTGMMKDIRRTYEYHGAEHKTIACYEAGEELTVENVKKHTRFHPRCGTSFIFITLIVSILVMCIVPVYQVLPRIIVSILMLPLVVGISYEFIRIAGRSSSWLTRALSWPGLQIQRITTREPDASQIECAIAALKPCIPADMEDDKW